MINHIRTLLLNKHASVAGISSGVPASEYVPEDFIPVAITADLSPVRNALGLADYSIFRLNYLLAGYMHLLHAPDISDYTLKFDTRYTYVFSNDVVFDKQLRYVELTGFNSTDSVRLAYNHYPYAATAGKFDTTISPATWTIKRTGETSISIQAEDSIPQRLKLIFSGGRSQDIELVPGCLSVYVLADGPLADDFTFHVRVFIPPVFSPTHTLEALRQVDSAYNLNSLLFVPWSDYADELQALSNIWQYSIEHSSRLAAAILGYAYRCERLRRGILIPGRDSTLRRYIT